MVIFSHVGNIYRDLPWPVKALSNFGFFGVQLFFLVSCFTLMHSWHARRRQDSAPIRNFFIRRLFRILPMYALAAAFYTALYPPPKIVPEILLATFTFLNGWSPSFLGTADDSWVVVPGGWSITAEFSFYMLFPWLAPMISSPRRALIAVAASLALAYFANAAALAAYVNDYGDRATGQFVYYWLPNQLSVFALGFLGYQLVDRLRVRRVAHLIRKIQAPLLGSLLILAAVIAYRPTSRLITLTPPYLPSHVLAALIFMGVLCVLALGGPSLMVNKATVALGKISFSAYLLHFAVISGLERTIPGLIGADRTGVEAISRCVMMLVCTTLLTILVSSATYRWVEQPMITLGNRQGRR